MSAVELLPVYQFDALAAPPGRDQLLGLPAGLVLRARTPRTAAAPTRPGAVDEFRDLVKALHRAGLEVILDVVYNHTAEGGADGPTFSYRGLGNDEYYILGPGGLVRGLHRHRQHARRERPGRPPADPRQPPLLGRGDARRRVPVRPRVGAVARRGRHARSRARRSSGTSTATRSSRAPSSSPRRGTRRACTRWARSSATAGSSGTAGSATTSASFVRGDPGRAWAVSQRITRQPGHLRARGPRAPEVGQLRHLPRRVHARRPRLVRHASTTRPTARTDRDGSDENLSLERRGRGPDGRPGDPGAPRAPGEEPADADPALGRRADADHGRRGPAQPAGQQQRLRPGQRAELVRLDRARARGRHAPVHRAG